MNQPVSASGTTGTTAAQSVVTIDRAALKAQGFTESGTSHFATTVAEYGATLFAKSTTFGDADKAPGMPAEVGHDHVRAAAFSIARSFGSPTRSAWSIAGQVGEYIATAAAGIGGGHLDKKEGIIAFAVGVSVAVILVVVRLVQGKGD